MTLFEARNKKNFSQMELAFKAGISQTQLSFIESGRAVPHPSTRRKLKRALGLKVDWIATRMGSTLTKGGFVERTDAADGVLQSIAHYIQSEQSNERAERFKFLRQFINKYEKKLETEAEQQTAKRRKKLR